tara:strand:+ start:170 stop:631 length:462 start_codon:yes stop_codon:yes gene_type:complete
MITKGKLVKTLFRFKKVRGTGVIVRMNVRGKETDVIAYEKDFPCGLLASKSFLIGKDLEIQFSPQTNSRSKIRYELLKWSNQSDQIKNGIINLLIAGIDKACVEGIPWEKEANKEHFIDLEIREQLERIYLGKNSTQINQEDSLNNKEIEENQ